MVFGNENLITPIAPGVVSPALGVFELARDLL